VAIGEQVEAIYHGLSNPSLKGANLERSLMDLLAISQGKIADADKISFAEEMSKIEGTNNATVLRNFRSAVSDIRFLDSIRVKDASSEDLITSKLKNTDSIIALFNPFTAAKGNARAAEALLRVLNRDHVGETELTAQELTKLKAYTKTPEKLGRSGIYVRALLSDSHEVRSVALQAMLHEAMSTMTNDMDKQKLCEHVVRTIGASDITQIDSDQGRTTIEDRAHKLMEHMQVVSRDTTSTKANNQTVRSVGNVATILNHFDQVMRMQDARLAIQNKIDIINSIIGTREAILQREFYQMVVGGDKMAMFQITDASNKAQKALKEAMSHGSTVAEINAKARAALANDPAALAILERIQEKNVPSTVFTDKDAMTDSSFMNLLQRMVSRLASFVHWTGLVKPSTEAKYGKGIVKDEAESTGGTELVEPSGSSKSEAPKSKPSPQANVERD
jgi:hypothetical protein